MAEKHTYDEACGPCGNVPCKMAEGGEVMDDNDAMLDQCAMECMKAIESKDGGMFRSSLEALVSDIVMKMQEMPDVDGA